MIKVPLDPKSMISEWHWGKLQGLPRLCVTPHVDTAPKSIPLLQQTRQWPVQSRVGRQTFGEPAHSLRQKTRHQTPNAATVFAGKTSDSLAVTVLQQSCQTQCFNDVLHTFALGVAEILTRAVNLNQ
jgi:hypothetical protein